MRKTKKYYRELIPTITSAKELEEVLLKVVKKYKPIGLKTKMECGLSLHLIFAMFIYKSLI